MVQKEDQYYQKVSSNRTTVELVKILVFNNQLILGERTKLIDYESVKLKEWAWQLHKSKRIKKIRNSRDIKS